MSLLITKKKLLECGIHFGHYANKWNPKMKKYIYYKKGNIHIINLSKIIFKLKDMYEVIKDLSSKNAKFLFVGVHKKTKELIKEYSEKLDCYYVNEKWIGGTFTNFNVVQKKVNKLWNLDLLKKSGKFELLTKKEQLKLEKEHSKLEKLVGGIKNMKSLPDAIFIVNLKLAKNAAIEARQKKIPIFSIIDTDLDPDLVDHFVPANDDSIKSIELVLQVVKEAILEGRKLCQTKNVFENVKNNDSSISTYDILTSHSKNQKEKEKTLNLFDKEIVSADSKKSEVKREKPSATSKEKEVKTEKNTKPITKKSSSSLENKEKENEKLDSSTTIKTEEESKKV